MATTENQVNAGLRHVLSYAGGGVTVLASLGFVDPENAKSLILALNEIGDGVQKVFGGISKIGIIIGPIMGVVGTTYAVKSATFRNQLASVIRSAQDKKEAKVELLEQTAEQLPVEKIVVSDPALAEATPSPKVTAS
jgi:hypothetical protein